MRLKLVGYSLNMAHKYGGPKPEASSGVSCVVMVPVRGLGEKSERVVNVRTAWALDHPGAAPRLASAYLRP
ncbi:MAG: hypothetical protein ABSH36_04555 [Solirubrobacteraceae bacterium]